MLNNQTNKNNNKAAFISLSFSYIKNDSVPKYSLKKIIPQLGFF